ncbi:hypothetical protein IEU95_15925 [Hoyosella rhizosphaerae]|uniref:TPR repeat domain-containing protein n=1 Tax=Hoyosella rhizosphaerae TaxID=1755582 RepID=A0A916UIB3_9ACTN|nr:hypothetical protein [Hoyosella rhizosphaerae]MBN4928324.1 hypothetical protein [Hoyosella rhizosphaerae]GGC74096.1 hypothetical protein GCM10011410_29120 [Hoyosella rhizosphaerae]
MSITRSTVMSWSPDSIGEYARQVRTAAEALFDSGKWLYGEFDRLAETWSGDAHAAAEDRVAHEWGRTRKIATMLEDLAEDIKSTDYTLGSACIALQELIGEIESQPITVSESWYVQPLTDNIDPSVVSAFQTRVNHLVGDLTHYDNTLAEQLTRFANEFNLFSRLRIGVDVGDATALGQALAVGVAEGTLTPELAELIGQQLAQLALTTAQLDALAAGDPVAVPADQLNYLRNLVEASGKDGILALSAYFDSLGTADGEASKAALANAVLTVSHENIGADITADGTVRSPGGFDRLPADLREMLTSERGDGLRLASGFDGLGDNLRDHVTDPSSGTPTRSEVREFAAFADLLNASEPTNAPGEQLGTHLLERAADFHALDENADAGVPRSKAFPDSSLYTPIADTFTDIATRNTDSSAAILTGTYSDGTDLANYDRDTTVATLLAFGNEPAQGLINWIPGDATSANPTVAQRAGEAAYGLAQTLSSNDSGIGGNNHNALLNLPGHNNQSIGQINPEMTQTIGETLTPYIPAIGQLEDHLTETFGFGSLTHGDAIRVFSVIDSDPEAAANFNGQVFAQIENLQYKQAAQALANPEEPQLRYAHTIGQLQTYVDHGYIVEGADRGADAQELHDAKTQAYQIASGIAATGAGAIPGIGFPAAATVIAVTGVLEQSVVGSVPGIETYEVPREDPLGSRQYYNTLLALEDLGALTPHPVLDRYMTEDGKLLPYEEALMADNPTQNPISGGSGIATDAGNYLLNHNFPIDRITQYVDKGRVEARKG